MYNGIANQLYIVSRLAPTKDNVYMNLSLSSTLRNMTKIYVYDKSHKYKNQVKLKGVTNLLLLWK